MGTERIWYNLPMVSIESIMNMRLRLTALEEAVSRIENKVYSGQSTVDTAHVSRETETNGDQKDELPGQLALPLAAPETGVGEAAQSHAGRHRRRRRNGDPAAD